MMNEWTGCAMIGGEKIAELKPVMTRVIFKTGDDSSSFEMTQVHISIELTQWLENDSGLESLNLQRVR